MNCPKCSAAMSEHLLEGVHLDRCNDCRGLWAQSGELSELTGAESDLRNIFSQVAQTDYLCPEGCKKRLEELRYSNMDRELLLDRCSDCGGIYLDEGEIERVLKLNTRIRDLFGDGTFAQSREAADGFFKRLFSGRR